MNPQGWYLFENLKPMISFDEHIFTLIIVIHDKINMCNQDIHHVLTYFRPLENKKNQILYQSM